MYTAICYLCKSTKYTKWRSISNYDLQQCDNCGFIFVFPLPSTETLKNFYEFFDYKDVPLQEVRIRKDAVRSLSLIKNHLEKENISLLDIGCGRGYLMDEARKLGWNTFGIDYSRNTIRYALKNLNLKVVQSDIGSYRTTTRYDVIVLSQFIEHVSNPNDILKKCYLLLKNNGFLYIATPNIKSISAKVLGVGFDHLIPPEHLGYYSRKTLERLLINNGFRILHAGSWSYKEDLAGIIKSIIKKESNKTIIKNSAIISSDKSISIKRIKYILFDEIFCKLFYQFLNINCFGTILEVLAVKK
ncbi:class I SAM-dependent methyltransferase [Candidatus Gottesmanbacteria bacterium]|nr:class I SAM-dependent methyltransferase [Candidatus Gottesmanbacteria bacterium]